MILIIRTDKPEAELYLYNQHDELVNFYQWYAHRQLSDTIFTKIDELLHKNQLNLSDLSGVIVYKGPGSFTGLRIGIAVANTLSYSLNIPIIGTTGADWIQVGLNKLKTQNEPLVVIPEYGSDANITAPRK